MIIGLGIFLKCYLRLKVELTLHQVMLMVFINEHDNEQVVSTKYKNFTIVYHTIDV